MSARNVIVLITCAVACGAPASPASAPATKPTADPCPRIGRAMKHTEAVVNSAPANAGSAFAEERREVAAATAGVERFATLATSYERASADAAVILGSGETTRVFADKMGAFMSHCTAPDCVPVIIQIGAHTMHQPDLGATLPLLATELEKTHLADGAMQAEMLELASASRKAAASMPIKDDPRLPAFHAARTALRDACAKAKPAE